MANLTLLVSWECYCKLVISGPISERHVSDEASHAGLLAKTEPEVEAAEQADAEEPPSPAHHEVSYIATLTIYFSTDPSLRTIK